MTSEHILIAHDGLLENDLKEVAQLFTEFEGAGQSRRLEIVLSLAKKIIDPQTERFKGLLLQVDIEGTVDVEGWHKHSIRALIQHCAEKKLPVTLKVGERYLTPVTWPSEGLMLEAFVNAIMTGEWE